MLPTIFSLSSMTDPGISESKTRGRTYFGFCSGLFIFLRRGAFELCCTDNISKNYLLFALKQLILKKFSPSKTYQKKNVCCLGSTPAATICRKHITEVRTIPYQNWKTSPSICTFIFLSTWILNAQGKSIYYYNLLHTTNLNHKVHYKKHEKVNCQRK